MLIEQLEKIMTHAPRPWLEELAKQMPGAGISTNEEQASFVAQLAHESAEFTQLEENLSYSAQRLVQVWPKRFATVDVAAPYSRNPEKLANLVYANRLGNGDIDSGDGWRYRGRGPIQLTGANNYILCGRGIGAALFSNPDLLLTPEIGIKSACWYWTVKGLNKLDDDNDVTAETKIINGGTNGLAQRQAYYDRALQVLKGKPV